MAGHAGSWRVRQIRGHLIGGLTAFYASMTDNAMTSDGGTVAAAQADAHAKLLGFLASR